MSAVYFQSKERFVYAADSQAWLKYLVLNAAITRLTLYDCWSLGVLSLILCDSQVVQPQLNGRTLLALLSLSMLVNVPVSQPMFLHGKFR